MATVLNVGLGLYGFQKRDSETEANDLPQTVPKVVKKTKQFGEICATELAEYWFFGQVPKSTSVGGAVEEILSKQGTDKYCGINSDLKIGESQAHLTTNDFSSEATVSEGTNKQRTSKMIEIYPLKHSDERDKMFCSFWSWTFRLKLHRNWQVIYSRNSRLFSTLGRWHLRFASSLVSYFILILQYNQNAIPTYHLHTEIC